MKFFISFFIFFCVPGLLLAQSFSGQWRGSFKETPVKGVAPYSANYVLTLKENGKQSDRHLLHILH